MNCFFRFFTRGLVAEYEKTVADRDRLIEELSTSEKKYRLLIETQSDMVVQLDPGGLILFGSLSFCRAFGKTEHELLDRPFIRQVHESDRERTARELARLHHPPYNGRIEHRAATTAGIRWLSWMATAVRDEAGTVTAVNGVGRDITEQRQMEDALKESEHLFQLITGNTSALVSIHDAEGTYLYASPSHQRLGFRPEDLIGQSGFSILDEADTDKFLAELEKARNGKLLKTVLNYRIRDKNGEIHTFRGAFDAVFDAEGTLERIVCVGEDITKLRKAQDQREKALSMAAEAKKLALLGQIAGKMAHDFNNILGIIMGVSELALIDCGEPAVRENLELILTQTLRGKNLTKNLVAFAKSQEPKQEFFKINDKIDLVANLLKKDLENISLRLEYGSNMADLLADPGMIEHALVNLIQNAVHALSKTPAPRIIIRTYGSDTHICFEITDNGCGIPGEHLADIYEPAFTLKGNRDTTGAYESGIKGTGYGMANVKKYIRQHNGSIQVESAPGDGTTFIVRLPVTRRELSPKEKTELTEEMAHFGKYILLVEDEPAIADVQYRILTQAPFDHTVDIAGTGQMAMDLFDRNDYDFVSLDYILPGNLSGMDVYLHIRKANPAVPVLFVSGNLEFLESIEALQRKDPFLDHLSKPCKNIDYVHRLNRLMTRVTT